MPPSTTSSQTTSAAFSPVCGRASTEFSILTASAALGGTCPLSRPVNGHSTGGGGGGGGGGVVGGALDAAAGAESDELQAASPPRTSPDSRTAPNPRRDSAAPPGSR